MSTILQDPQMEKGNVMDRGIRESLPGIEKLSGKSSNSL